MALRGIAAEVARVMRVADRSVQRQIDEATALVEDYPATLEAWEARGDHPRACAGDHRDRAQSAPRARGRRSNAKRSPLRGRHPRPGAGRAAAARRAAASPHAGRTAHSTPADSGACGSCRWGMGCRICRTTPSLLADAIYDRLTQQARTHHRCARTGRGRPPRAAAAAEPRGTDASRMPRTATRNRRAQQVIASDTRTMGQLRADLLTDMLLTSPPGADPTRTDDGPGTLGAIRAKVQVVVPVLTLLGRDDAPADLVGTLPIDPATARELAGLTRRPWSGSSPTPSPGPSSTSTPTSAPRRSTGTCAHGTSTAGSPDAASPPSAAKSTTPSTPPSAVHGRAETSRICVKTPQHEAIHRVEGPTTPRRHPAMDLTPRARHPRPPTLARRALHPDRGRSERGRPERG